MKSLIRITFLGAGLVLGGALRADTFILKDGSFVEGEVKLETSTTVHITTRFGTRVYRRKDIRDVIESVDALDPQAVNNFPELPGPVKTVLNAQAEYDLEKYEAAMQRLEPLRDYQGSRALRMRIDWLIIEINERLGRWEEARALLEAKKKKGTPREKIRAKAHLAIFDANPDYDLRYVGEKHARNFIRDETLLARARRRGALKDHKLMRLALEEYCEQLLVENDWSVKAFADKLDPESTYEACKKLPLTGDVSRHLPYIEHLKQAEATLLKAQAILGDYGRAFEMDLVRTELYHLWPVLTRMLGEITALSPENLTPAFDRRTGRLTKAGREQWRQRCDEFLSAARPVVRLLDYMIDRVEHYPQGLRDLRKTLLDYDELIKHMVKAVRKARNRTHV